MTNGLEDLVTSLQILSDLMEDNGCDMGDFDYVEFLTDTVPALGERIEREALQVAYRRTLELDPNNATKLRGWYEDMGISLEEDVDE
jgi:hypothetical protein